MARDSNYFRFAADMLVASAERSGLLLLLLAGACTWLTEPGLPPGRVAFDRPLVYEKWWSLTEACSGRTGDLNAIRWYVLPSATTIPSSSGASAVWYAAPNAIVFPAGEQFDGELVRHEMLHALLRSPRHDRDAFIERCRGVVVCIDACIRDAGSAPPPNPAAVPVKPDDLAVSVEVSEAAPRTDTDSAYYMMVVTARNPLAVPIQVQLAPSGDAGPPASFSYDLRHASGGYSFDMRADVPEDTRFAPGEAKRYIFDFRIGPCCLRFQIPPATYTFGGAYGLVWAPNPPTVTVP